ncbi:MAG TPA: hypothetical protein VF297_04395 [Pyrinomonadaceae bacterium]
MVIGLTLSLLVLLVPATLLVQLLWPPKSLLRPPLLLKTILGMGLGLGTSSVLLFVWLRAFGSLSGVYIAVEASLALCFVAALVYLCRKNGAPTEVVRRVVPGASPLLTRLSAGAFFISAGCILAAAVAISAREPHGAGDASAIWNLIARFIYRGGSGWADALTHNLNWTHPDYPLLVPLSVARLWIYGGETQFAPALLGILFLLGTLGLVVSSVSLLSTRTQGYLAGLVLLEPFFFFRTATFQYADTPLGFFLLAALVLLCLYDRAPEGFGLLALAGLMTGFAAWTKNEGLLILLAVVAGRFVALAVSRGLRTYVRQLLYFAAGAVPVLLVVVYFKAAIAPANDLVAGQGARATAERLLDFSRYVLILKAVVNHFTGFRGWYAHPSYLLVVYAWLVGLKTERAGRVTLLTLAAALGFILAGYFFIYVTTPRDLEWQLAFSLDRLLIQLWPSFVLLFFLAVRSPEEALARLPESAK